MSYPHKVCLITGPTAGIGRATAEALATQGMEVVLLARNPDKLARAEHEIRQACGHERVWSIQADLSRLDDVRAAAQTFLETGKPLDVLLNNAGIVNNERRVTVDGFEETWAVNHLAYFLLTNLLLPRLQESAPSRVINVASDAYMGARSIHWEDVGFERGGYKTFGAYAQSKLANILFTRALAERLRGTGVTANALHPGGVRTGLGQQNEIPLWMRPLIKMITAVLATPEKGAQTSVWLATAQLETSGGYFAKSKPRKLKAWARDQEAAERLWALSAEQVGL